jgi:hypothetical protein
MHMKRSQYFCITFDFLAVNSSSAKSSLRRLEVHVANGFHKKEWQALAMLCLLLKKTRLILMLCCIRTPKTVFGSYVFLSVTVPVP